MFPLLTQPDWRAWMQERFVCRCICLKGGWAQWHLVAVPSYLHLYFCCTEYGALVLNVLWSSFVDPRKNVAVPSMLSVKMSCSWFVFTIEYNDTDLLPITQLLPVIVIHCFKYCFIKLSCPFWKLKCCHLQFGFKAATMLLRYVFGLCYSK